MAIEEVAGLTAYLKNKVTELGFLAGRRRIWQGQGHDGYYDGAACCSLAANLLRHARTHPIRTATHNNAGVNNSSPE